MKRYDDEQQRIEARRETNRKYYEKTRESRPAKQKAYYEANREKISQKNKMNYQKRIV